MNWHKRLFAWALAHGNGRYERFMGARKRELLSSLTGTVVEIGPGTGANLRYYPPGVRWVGIEPNPYMHEYIRLEASRLRMDVTLEEKGIEDVSMSDGAADAVVSTLVLCSIDRPEPALRKILHLLKPGGRFFFIEHVAAPSGTWRRGLQRGVCPIWEIVFDHCRPDRETKAIIECAGFSEVHCEEFSAPLPIVGRQIAGWARKSQ